MKANEIKADTAYYYCTKNDWQHETYMSGWDRGEIQFPTLTRYTKRYSYGTASGDNMVPSNTGPYLKGVHSNGSEYFIQPRYVRAEFAEAQRITAENAKKSSDARTALQAHNKAAGERADALDARFRALGFGPAVRVLTETPTYRQGRAQVALKLMEEQIVEILERLERAEAPEK